MKIRFPRPMWTVCLHWPGESLYSCFPDACIAVHTPEQLSPPHRFPYAAMGGCLRNSTLINHRKGVQTPFRNTPCSHHPISSSDSPDSCNRCYALSVPVPIYQQSAHNNRGSPDWKGSRKCQEYSKGSALLPHWTSGSVFE